MISNQLAVRKSSTRACLFIKLLTAPKVDNYNTPYNNQTVLSVFPTPTITLTVAPTFIPTVTPIPTPTLVPTVILQSTNFSSSNSSSNNQSIQSSDNEVPISKELASSVLGISSSEKELITPATKVTEQKETKKEIKKSSIWNIILPSTFSAILGGIVWLFKKKFFKK